MSLFCKLIVLLLLPLLGVGNEPSVGLCLGGGGVDSAEASVPSEGEALARFHKDEVVPDSGLGQPISPREDLSPWSIIETGTDDDAAVKASDDLDSTLSGKTSNESPDVTESDSNKEGISEASSEDPEPGTETTRKCPEGTDESAAPKNPSLETEDSNDSAAPRQTSHRPGNGLPTHLDKSHTKDVEESNKPWWAFLRLLNYEASVQSSMIESPSEETEVSGPFNLESVVETPPEGAEYSNSGCVCSAVSQKDESKSGYLHGNAWTAVCVLGLLLPAYKLAALCNIDVWIRVGASVFSLVTVIFLPKQLLGNAAYLVPLLELVVMVVQVNMIAASSDISFMNKVVANGLVLLYPSIASGFSALLSAAYESAVPIGALVGGICMFDTYFPFHRLALTIAQAVLHAGSLAIVIYFTVQPIALGVAVAFCSSGMYIAAVVIYVRDKGESFLLFFAVSLVSALALAIIL